MTGATERTVREWIRKNLFISRKVGRRVWVDRQTLLAYLESRGIECQGKMEDEREFYGERQS